MDGALLSKSAFALAAVLVVGPHLLAAARHSPLLTSASCNTREYRAFDFFAGDWDAFEIDNPNKAVAHNRVEWILDGCVLLENYEGADNSHGQSFTIYDAPRKLWHQTWVTNHGALLMIEGNLQGDSMVLSGTDRTQDGKERQVRGIWKPMPGCVRETAVTSMDGGATWTQWFDLIFRAATSTNSGPAKHDDKTVLAALDTEYQAAVKRNDAVTMDRLLADDFILVTGSGKIYNKAELLAEARSGEISYVHQEDTEQTVRVWGDCAVVTAKLWEQGEQAGKPFDYTVWFSDTYVRTPNGWKYVFGQSSLPLPKPTKQP